MKRTAVLLPMLAIFLCAAPAFAASPPKVAEDADSSVLLAAYTPPAAHASGTHGKAAAKPGKHAKAGKQAQSGKTAKPGKHSRQAKGVVHKPAAKSLRHASRSPKAAQQKTTRVHAALPLPTGALA